MSKKSLFPTFAELKQLSEDFVGWIRELPTWGKLLFWAIIFISWFLIFIVGDAL